MFVVKKMVEKSVQKAIQGGVALLLAKIGVDTLASAGVVINQEALVAALTVLVLGAMEAARNFAKVKWGWKIL